MNAVLLKQLWQCAAQFREHKPVPIRKSVIQSVSNETQINLHAAPVWVVICSITFCYTEYWPVTPFIFSKASSWISCLPGCSAGGWTEPGVEFVSLFVFAFPGPDGVQLIVNLIFDVLGSCLSYCCVLLCSATANHLMVGGCEKGVKIFI